MTLAVATGFPPDDPLLTTLPPTTDHFTYLTILEYQLTAHRLPLLHTILQDAELTANIGWDLVQLLVPLVPARGSVECLGTVARLGNPREVILRVDEVLMGLEAVEGEEEDDNASDSEETTTLPKQYTAQFTILLSMLSTLHTRLRTKFPARFFATSLQAALEAYTAAPSHLTTISLLEFLRELSGRRRPAPPPRRGAAGAQNANATRGAIAPDPEGEGKGGAGQHAGEGEEDGGGETEEIAKVRRLAQFGLLEILKTYLLHCSEQAPAGMLWAVRLQEAETERQKQSASRPLSSPPTPSIIATFTNLPHLRARDLMLGKITALSRDFGLTDAFLAGVVGADIALPEAVHQQQLQPPPLDFDDVPNVRAEQIPLEPHGVLLVFTARVMAGVLFGGGGSGVAGSGVPNPSPGDGGSTTPREVMDIPWLARVFSNFLGDYATPYDGVLAEPAALIDALLALTLVVLGDRSPGISHDLRQPQEQQQQSCYMSSLSPSNFFTLLLQVTACVQAPGFRSHGSLGRVPAALYAAHPEASVRFGVLYDVLHGRETSSRDEEMDGKGYGYEYAYAREPALGWLKMEILDLIVSNGENKDNNGNEDYHEGSGSQSTLPSPFTDSTRLSTLFDGIYTLPENLVPTSTSVSTGNGTPNTGDHTTPTPWFAFVHTVPFYLTALNLYYTLLVRAGRDAGDTAIPTSVLKAAINHPRRQREFVVPLKVACARMVETAKAVEADAGADDGDGEGGGSSRHTKDGDEGSSGAVSAMQSATDLMEHLIGRVEEASSGF